MKKKTQILISLLLIVMIAIIMILLSLNHINHNKNKPLYAGNVLVPAKWRKKALKLGYYCPSWNANAASQIEVGSICLKLNH